jgi:polar amino acid transport system substrate-binding protein
MPKMKRSRWTLFVLISVFLIVSGCRDDDTPRQAETDAAMSGELNALLPDDIRAAGVIKTGGPVTEPPTLYLEEDATTRTGYMTDLAKAVGDLLGVKIAHTEMPFPSLVPGLQRGSIDMTLTISDKKTHHAFLDFVDCLENGLMILVPAGNPKGFDSLESLCGHTVAVLAGSIAVGVVTEVNKSCAVAMKIKEFPGASYAQLAVRSGQADATFGGGTAMHYVSAHVEDGTVFEVAPGGPYTVQPDAFAFLKGNDELRDAVQAAMQRLVDNGSAAKILAKYDVDSEGLYDPIPINVVAPAVE